MFLVANLVAYYAMRERAAEFGMTADMLAKNDLVIDGGLRSLEICKRAGVPVAYGSDLLGELQVDQSREFLLRREVAVADRDHPLGDDDRRQGAAPGGQARHAEGRAPSPTSSSSTAIRSRISTCSRIRAGISR